MCCFYSNDCGVSAHSSHEENIHQAHGHEAASEHRAEGEKFPERQGIISGCSIKLNAINECLNSSLFLS